MIFFLSLPESSDFPKSKESKHIRLNQGEKVLTKRNLKTTKHQQIQVRLSTRSYEKDNPIESKIVG